MSELVLKIQNAQGSNDALEKLIAEYQSFILACASRAVNHFVTKSDDEWSIALIAFNEAVQNYDSTKGDFRGFSNLIIRRRLNDHLKKEYRRMNEVPTEPMILQGGLSMGENEAAGDDGTHAAEAVSEDSVSGNTAAWPGSSWKRPAPPGKKSPSSSTARFWNALVLCKLQICLGEFSPKQIQ